MMDEPLKIQRLTSVDDRLISQLNEVFDEGTVWDHQQGNAFLEDADNLFLIAWWEGQIRGYLTGHRLQRFDRRQAEVLLYEINVHASAQRKGIGKALIGEVNRWAKDVGADEVWVLTEADNTAAMAMYASAGGVEDTSDTRMFTYILE